MLSVTVEHGVCQGYGNCVIEAPDVFDLDNEGLVVVLNPEVDDAQAAVVTAAVGSCPVKALTIGAGT